MNWKEEEIKRIEIIITGLRCNCLLGHNECRKCKLTAKIKGLKEKTEKKDAYKEDR